MATLSTEDRQKITRGLMSYWSSIWEVTDISMQDLQLAINATDNWIEAEQSEFNLSLPPAAQSGLTVAQKTLMFCAVALARVSIPFLRRIFGGID